MFLVVCFEVLDLGVVSARCCVYFLHALCSDLPVALLQLAHRLCMLRLL